MKSIDLARRLLLISNSTLHGGGYLDHAEEEIRNFVGKAAKTILVPFAVHDWGIYAAKAQDRFRDMGFSLTSIHDLSNMPRAIDEADVIFVGGGNTFRLLNGLYNHDLLGPIRRRVAAGMPYIGSSAGSIVMGETQEERILQFLEENEEPVVGLREGSILRVQDGAVTLKGPNTARIFRRYEEPVEATTGSNLCPVLWEASTVGARS